MMNVMAGLLCANLTACSNNPDDRLFEINPIDARVIPELAVDCPPERTGAQQQKCEITVGNRISEFSKFIYGDKKTTPAMITACQNPTKTGNHQQNNIFLETCAKSFRGRSIDDQVTFEI